ncbi:Melanotransferrin [Trichinella pseudospiralis]|uniref:Melanotransferrin n=1 Tax=Trichinella pseudospiralis TaxID=6337 RepID=A0A0V0YIT2_TRIPS|nr:Melanotransferrin [Trichinella pseudospiralis]
MWTATTTTMAIATLLWLPSFKFSLQTTRWCVLDSPENRKLCTEMVNDLEKMLNNAGKIGCVFGKHRVDCMRQVGDGLADCINLQAEEIYAAGRYLQLRPTLAERWLGEEFAEQSFAVVRRRTMDNVPPSVHRWLKQLENKRLCLPELSERSIHYQALANVILPLGVVREEQIHCQSTAQTLANFFGPSCMPGQWIQLNKHSGQSPNDHAQCALCHDDCSKEDQHAGEQGSLRCLTKYDADIAFTSRPALLQWIASSSGNATSASNTSRRFRLLCLHGQLADLESTSCAWFARKTNAIATAPLDNNPTTATTVKTVVDIFNLFKKSKPNWFKQLLFTGDQVSELIRLQYHSTYERYLGNLFVRSFESPFPEQICPKWNVKLCVVGQEKMRKCVDMAIAWATVRLKPTIECHLANHRRQCLSRVRSGQSDITLIPTPEAIQAQTFDSIVPVAMEVSSKDPMASYVLAVVNKRKTNSAVKHHRHLFHNAQVCFDNERTKAIVMVSLELDGMLQMRQCQFQQAAKDFFNTKPICTGTIVRRENSLCKLCRNFNSYNFLWKPYYTTDISNSAAEFEADIAFLHLTVDQIHKLRHGSNFLNLLCPNGQRKQINDYSKCNWLETPNSVIVTSTVHQDLTSRRQITDLLVHGQQYYAIKSKDKFSIFPTTTDPSSIFNERTKSLKAILSEEENQPNVLGTKVYGARTFRVYQKLSKCSAASKHQLCILLFLCMHYMSNVELFFQHT